MAQAITIGSTWLAGVGRAATRNIRLTVLVCIVLICGSFGAAAFLQMQNDKLHAVQQAQYYEAERARDVAAAAGASFDRLAALGRAFADGQTVGGAADGVKNIAVFDSTGLALSSMKNDQADALPLEAIWIHDRDLFAGNRMTFPYGDKIVAVDFDARALIPTRLLARAALSLKSGKVLAQNSAFQTGGAAGAGPGGPAGGRTAGDGDAALAAWTGSLPLYLVVILGPA